MGYYEKATICLNGHVISYRHMKYSKHCKKCGEETISLCSNCNNYIQGGYYIRDFGIAGGYTRPSYCHACGKPYPWTTKILDNAVELISLDDDLPKNHKEVIKLALPDLLVESPTTPVAVAKYKKYISSAQGFVKDGLKNLMIDVVTETVKKSL